MARSILAFLAFLPILLVAGYGIWVLIQSVKNKPPVFDEDVY